MTKVFIGGSRKLTKLPAAVQDRIDNIIENGFIVLVGDANGTDKCVQSYLASRNYEDVEVFCMAGACRNNVGTWKVRKIASTTDNRDFRFYATKDLEMAKEASYGFMIWDAKSNGTLNNIINLLERDKKVLVYLSPDKAFYTLRGFHDLPELLARCDKEALEGFDKKLGIMHCLREKQVELNFA
jgi:hypothetical protein